MKHLILCSLFLAACQPSGGGSSDDDATVVVVGDAAIDAGVAADATMGDAIVTDAAVEADAASIEVDTEAVLRAHVAMLAETIGARSSQQPERLADSIDYLVDALGATGHEVGRQDFTVDGQTFSNLWIEIPGTVAPEQIVVFGAHYDSVPGTPGADDNATGSAATLALAARFADDPQPRTLRFVLFTNEEPPFFQTEDMGSLRYARMIAQRGDQVVAMASLEMLGFYTDEPDSQEMPLGLTGLFPSTGNFIAFVSNLESQALLDEMHATFVESGFPGEKLAAPGNLPEAGFSDQWSFWQVGYPGVMITDTAFFRNPHYHAPTDSVGTLDFVRFAAVVDGLEAVVEGAATP
jgi:Zn-dependent M28 family amino/carboxypeptidase